MTDDTGEVVTLQLTEADGSTSSIGVRFLDPDNLVIKGDDGEELHLRRSH